MIQIILFILPAFISASFLEYLLNKSTNFYIYIKRAIIFINLINFMVIGSFYFLTNIDLSLEDKSLYTIGFCIKYLLIALIFAILNTVIAYVIIKKVKTILVFRGK